MAFNPMDFFQAGGELGKANASPFTYGASNVMDQFKMGQQLQMQLMGQLGLKNAENQLPMNPTERKLKEAQTTYYGGDGTSQGSSFDENGMPTFSGGIKQQQLQLQKMKFSQDQWNKISELSNPAKASSRSTLGMAANANLRADRARVTLNGPMTTNQDAQNVFADIAGIYAGGTPTDIGMQEGSYTSLQQKAMGAIQGLSGKPTDALPPEFKKHLLGVLDDLQSTNNDLIKRHFDYQEAQNPWVVGMHKKEWEGMKASMLPKQQNSFQQKALGGNSSGDMRTQINSEIHSLVQSGVPEEQAINQTLLKHNIKR